MVNQTRSAACLLFVLSLPSPCLCRIFLLCMGTDMQLCVIGLGRLVYEGLVLAKGLGNIPCFLARAYMC